MDVFDYDGDWDIDKKADLLNASLFGKKKLKKTGTTREPKMKDNSVSTFKGTDSDDEVYSKKEKRKIKERRRKKRKVGNTVEDETWGKEHKQKENNQQSEVSKKKKFERGDINPSQRLQKKEDGSNDGAMASKSFCKKKQKLVLEGQQSETSMKRKKLIKNKESTVAVESGIKVADEKKRKRKHLENLSAENSSKSKKVKLSNPKTQLENGEPPTKKRRNRKKKNNCKKNKYKHLALNSIEKSVSPPVEDENLVLNPSIKLSTSDKGNKRSLTLDDAGHEGKLKKRKLSKEVSLVTSEEVNNEEYLSENKVKNFPKDVTTKESRKNTKIEKVSKQKLNQSMVQKLLQNTENKKINDKNASQKLSLGKVTITKIKPQPNPSKMENTISTSRDEDENGFVPKQTEQGNSIWKSSTITASHMKEQAMAKLNSARFRFINEQLYTQSGKDALQMFQEDRDAFKVYHDGFQSQVKKWSVNPLDIIIRQLKNKQKKLVVADFGCGDARLAESIPHKVHSFDLVALNKRVTVCEMSKTPLQNETMDVAVFCLSLMGTSLSDYIKEANRVLRTGGLLKIAEVESRFSALSSFTDAVCNHGFQLLNKRKVSEMFYLLDFKKLKAVTKLPPRSAISLKACIYKKR